jgi:YfiH family protein
MNKKEHLVYYNLFAPHRNLLAFSTTKKTIKNHLPRFTGDSPEIFQGSREQLAKILNIEPVQLVFPRQTHTNCVAELSEIPLQELKETDALLTNRAGICLCVQTADCVPILLFDPETKAISAIHAGWRGTVQKIAEVAVQKMISKYHSLPGNILALIGPSIGPGVYEVGDEVVGQVRKNIPDAETTLFKNRKGNFHFNLWEANRRVLLNCGLSPEKIEVSGECSFTENEKYFSARRDGVETGRMVSGIMLINDTQTG